MQFDDATEELKYHVPLIDSICKRFPSLLCQLRTEMKALLEDENSADDEMTDTPPIKNLCIIFTRLLHLSLSFTGIWPSHIKAQVQSIQSAVLQTAVVSDTPTCASIISLTSQDAAGHVYSDDQLFELFADTYAYTVDGM